MPPSPSAEVPVSPPSSPLPAPAERSGTPRESPVSAHSLLWRGTAAPGAAAVAASPPHAHRRCPFLPFTCCLNPPRCPGTGRARTAPAGVPPREFGSSPVVLPPSHFPQPEGSASRSRLKPRGKSPFPAALGGGSGSSPARSGARMRRRRDGRPSARGRCGAQSLLVSHRGVSSPHFSSVNGFRVSPSPWPHPVPSTAVTGQICN